MKWFSPSDRLTDGDCPSSKRDSATRRPVRRACVSPKSQPPRAAPGMHGGATPWTCTIRTTGPTGNVSPTRYVTRSDHSSSKQRVPNVAVATLALRFSIPRSLDDPVEPHSHPNPIRYLSQSVMEIPPLQSVRPEPRHHGTGVRTFAPCERSNPCRSVRNCWI